MVALRLPFAAAPEGPDEGGYLAIARQWHGAGSSLYGRYWVDRPPLLLTLFQLASRLGGSDGLVALRLVGAAAAGIAVLAAASTARRVGGRRAGAWAAVAAGALFVSPLMGTVHVNGELLAAPFVAVGIRSAVGASATARARAGWAAVGTGACAAAALLVKQNMIEVFVFAAVTWSAAAWTGAVGRRRLALLVGGAGAGAIAVLVAAGVWTVAHGTSLSGVYDAMYPFRVKAAAVIAAHSGSPDLHRLEQLLTGWAVSGTLVVTAVFSWLVARRRVRGPVAWAVLATLGYATVSMLLGGGFWTHYLVELIVPAAIALGLLVASRPALARQLGIAVATVALLGWGVALWLPAARPGVAIGAAVARAARPGDTLVSAFGNAETVQTSGLVSPYPFLWTLPAQTLDPRLRLLRRTLVAAHAPTWFVPWNRASFHRLRLDHLNALVRSRYRAVGRVCGRTVFLHDGLHRPVPTPVTGCEAAPVVRTDLRAVVRLAAGLVR